METPPKGARPVVDPRKCEGKAECVRVCPYDVFEIGRLDPATYAGFSLLAKLKARVHGMKTALTPHLDACQSCGLCVQACPEKAIRLSRDA